MDLSGLTDQELLSRRHQAFLRLRSAHGPDPVRASAYEEIGLINRELVRRRPPRPEREGLRLEGSTSRHSRAGEG